MLIIIVRLVKDFTVKHRHEVYQRLYVGLFFGGVDILL